MSTIDTSTWNPDANLNTEIEGIPLNADAGIAQTWQALRVLMAAVKGDGDTIKSMIDVMQGATASADGASGLVPKPEAGDQDKFLKGDGTWDEPTDTTYNEATQSASGLMSASDKTKLDGIEAGADVNVVETVKVNGTALAVTGKAVDVAVPQASSTTPSAAGTASAGSETAWARGDHVHPIQTSVSGNAGTATRLQTPKSIFGHSFDGTGDVTGAMTSVSHVEFTGVASSAGHGGFLDFRFNGSTADYTSRIIESASGTIKINQVSITGSTITGSLANSSDERLKTPLSAVPDEVLDAWEAVGWGQFQFLAAIAEKGADKARLHLGLIAQHIKTAFAARGLDACRYGILCCDSDGFWSVRYAEAFVLESLCQRRKADRLEARIAALEERMNG